MDKIQEAQLPKKEELRNKSAEVQEMRQGKRAHKQIRPSFLQAVLQGNCRGDWI